MVHRITPPYAPEPYKFILPALASLAGRAADGPDKEIALAVWTAARLAAATTSPFTIAPTVRSIRAERATSWLNSISLPQPAKMAILRVFDATKMYPAMTADALQELVTTVEGHIDVPAKQELLGLIAHLRGGSSLRG